MARRPLYGSLIDVLNRASPLALVALGMTLVIATRGIDLSVGADVTMTAGTSLAADRRRLIMKNSSRAPGPRAMSLALMAALALAALYRFWDGMLVARVGSRRSSRP